MQAFGKKPEQSQQQVAAAAQRILRVHGMPALRSTLGPVKSRRTRFSIYRAAQLLPLSLPLAELGQYGSTTWAELKQLQPRVAAMERALAAEPLVSKAAPKRGAYVLLPEETPNAGKTDSLLQQLATEVFVEERRSEYATLLVQVLMSIRQLTVRRQATTFQIKAGRALERTLKQLQSTQVVNPTTESVPLVDKFSVIQTKLRAALAQVKRKENRFLALADDVSEALTALRLSERGIRRIFQRRIIPSAVPLSLYARSSLTL
jgi:hypothetical protein